MRRSPFIAAALTAAVCLSACHAPSEQELHKREQQQAAQVVLGPPLAIVVIDHTGSTMHYRKRIYEVVHRFVEEFQKEHDVDVRFIRLDSKPKMLDELYVHQGKVTQAKWKLFEESFSGTGPDGEGTDQVGALEMVRDLAKGAPTEKPEQIALCYFSDMIIDQPKGKPGTFKTWDQWNWKDLAGLNVKGGFYFVNNDRHAGPTLTDLSSKASQEGFNAKWRDPGPIMAASDAGDIELPID